MIVVKFTDKTFRSLTNDSLQFMDDAGQLHLIGFRLCRKNWVASVNASHDRPTFINEADTECIGEGDSITYPMYIELFSEPHVRFEFRKSMFKPAPGYQHYAHLKRQFEQVGWRTLDLS